MRDGDELVRVLPWRDQDPIRAALALVLVVLLFTGAAAVRVHGAVWNDPSAAAVLEDVGTVADGDVTTATDSLVTPAEEPQPQVEPEHFTVGDLAAGRVPQDVQDRFWQAQLDAILAAPCPGAQAAGGTAVTLYLGADEAWTARLTDASEAHRAACVA